VPWRFLFRYEGVDSFCRPTIGIHTSHLPVCQAGARTLKTSANIPSDRRLEKGEETRRAIIEIATRLFTERGYAAVPIEAVLTVRQISRGGLYYHFASKEELLEAVFEAVEIDVRARVLASSTSAGSAPAAARAACEAFLDLALDPVVRQIMLTDAPSVLSWDKWREIDERHALGLMKAAFEPAAKEAGIPDALVDPFTHMLLASLSEIALMIAEADDAPLALANGKSAVRELLARILAHPPRG
jgi:AcrR family transcriptional regulator